MKHLLFILLLVNGLTGIAQIPPEPSGRDIEIDIDMNDQNIPVYDGMLEIGLNWTYYEENGKFGFIDAKNGRQEAIYDQIISSHRAYIVKKGNLYGLADSKGMLKSKVEFDSIGKSYNNTFIIKKLGKYGTMSDSGNLVLSPKYKQILFSDGKNPVSFIKDKNDEVQLIFNKRENKFKRKIEYAQVYSNLVIVKSNGKFGVITNEVIVPFEYDSIFFPTNNSNSNAALFSAIKVKKRYPIDYSPFQRSAEFIAVIKNGKFGLIDQEGTVIYPPDNDAVNNVEPFEYCVIKKGKYHGIYFKSGKKKTEIEFDHVTKDGGGFVMPVKDDKAGVFNLQGEQIIPFEYDRFGIKQLQAIGFFVSKNEKHGIIDLEGKILVPIIYDEVQSFYLSSTREFFQVKLGNKYGVVNLKGDIIIPVEFAGVHYEDDGFLVRTSDPYRKYGLFDKTGKFIVAPEYEWIGKGETENTKITILRKSNRSYNFLNAQKELILSQNICEYGYVIDENQLLKPFSSRDYPLLSVTDSTGKMGMINEISGTLDIPIVYDDIIQKFESNQHTYFSIKFGKKFGLINEKNEVIIPTIYDAISLNLVAVEDNKSDESIQVVVKENKLFGSINLKNEVLIPFQYIDLQRISHTGLYKAKKGNQYQIINATGELICEHKFDEVANFERSQKNYNSDGSDEALTFSNGKMKVINDKGEFTTSEVPMEPHNGFTSFDELKFALIEALDSDGARDSVLKDLAGPERTLLTDFVKKIAPSPHVLYYLKFNTFDPNISLNEVDWEYIQHSYYLELLRFKERYWNTNSITKYPRESLTEVEDYTLRRRDMVINLRNTDFDYAGNDFMEKLLRNAIKINGYWISSYFMKSTFKQF